MIKGRVTILETNIIYLLVALLLVFIGAYVQAVNIKVGLLITEYVLVLLPVIILLKIKDISLKVFLKANKLRLKHVLIIIGATILLYPVAVFLNFLVFTILNAFGFSIKPIPIPTANNSLEYIALLFIIAISAGICEEVFFRGLLLRTYEKKYKSAGIIITAIMFGIFHFNIQNLMGPIILGLFFGYLVYLTDSIYAGIIGHITNNAFAVTLMYGLNMLQKNFVDYSDIVSENAMPNPFQMFIACIMIGIISAMTGSLAYLLITIIKKDMNSNLTWEEHLHNENLNYERNIDSKPTKEEKFKVVKYIPVLVVFILYIIIIFKQLSNSI